MIIRAIHFEAASNIDSIVPTDLRLPYTILPSCERSLWSATWRASVRHKDVVDAMHYMIIAIQGKSPSRPSGQNHTVRKFAIAVQGSSSGDLQGMSGPFNQPQRVPAIGTDA